MATYTDLLTADFNHLLESLHNSILQQSASATYEDGCYYGEVGHRSAMRVYERYSYFGGNRVSLSLLLTEEGDHVRVTGITSGGSQAVLFKINTVGEENFLSTLETAVIEYRRRNC